MRGIHGEPSNSQTDHDQAVSNNKKTEWVLYGLSVIFVVLGVGPILGGLLRNDRFFGFAYIGPHYPVVLIRPIWSNAMRKTKQSVILRMLALRKKNALAASAASDRLVAATAAILWAGFMRRSPMLWALATLFLLGASLANAQNTVTWRLNNVVLDDGAVATGFVVFTVFNSQSGAMTDWNIQISGGNTSLFPAFTFTPANSTQGFWGLCGPGASPGVCLGGPIATVSNQTFPFINYPSNQPLSLLLSISGSYSLLNTLVTSYPLATGPFNSCEGFFLATGGCRYVISGSITAASSPPLEITTTSLPNACGAYSTTLTAAGGTGGYTWSIVSPPAGFALNPATGVLSSTGIPQVPANSYSFTVSVADSAGNTATQPLTLDVPLNINLLPYAGTPASGDGIPTTMNASFTPTDTNGSLVTLHDAEAACGFTGFDWVQTVTVDPGGAYSYNTCTANGGTVDPKNGNCTIPIPSLTAPFSDPPQGGYTYDYVTWINQWLSQPGLNVPHFNDTQGFYYSPEDVATGCAIAHVASAGNCSTPPTLMGCDKRMTSDSFTLNFFDLPGRTSYPPKGPRFIELQTELVGLLCPQGTTCANPQPSVPLYKWIWKTNFTPSCSGPGMGGIFGIFPPPSFNPIPSSQVSGIGGITITSLNDLPQRPPSITCAATPNSLWPPNGKPVEVTVSGAVTPGTQTIPAGGTTYAVMEKYGLVQPSGGFTADVGGSYSFTVPLIAARDGNDLNGRTYTISVIATDQIGNVGSCSAVVTVPHDQGN
jgi:hypothetical protein